jgi:Arc-like DNA binding dprotein
MDVNSKVVHPRGMARDDPYFRLRIPESLKAKVQEAADRNKRSMTAEIIARLEESFSATEGRSVIDDMLYVLIDAEGVPISWQEIFTHAIGMNRALGGVPQSQHIVVYSDENVSSSRREDYDFKLIEAYRRVQRDAARRKKEGKPATVQGPPPSREMKADNEATGGVEKPRTRSPAKRPM